MFEVCGQLRNLATAHHAMLVWDSVKYNESACAEADMRLKWRDVAFDFKDNDCGVETDGRSTTLGTDSCVE